MPETSMVKSIYGDNIFREIACYPQPYSIECTERLRDLRELGITEFYYYGETLIGRFRVLGKGHAGIVVLCSNDNRIGVCKILRVDSKKHSLENEARILRKLDHLGVSPILYSFSNTVVFVEYIKGIKLSQYLDCADRGSLIKMISKLVESTFLLDKIGVSHGELSRPAKHVLITRGDIPRIVDFEYASLSRKPRNQTQVFSALFFSRNTISHKVASILGGKLFVCIQKELFSIVQSKRGVNRDMFIKIIEKCS